MEVEGTLAQFQLRELIEMAVFSSVSGHLEVETSEGIGRIYFEDGQPRHAALADMTGFDAVVVMFEHRDAPFRFVAGGRPPGDTLWTDPWELIERAEETAAAWAPIRPAIPSLHFVPEMRTQIGADQIHIGEDEWTVLSAVDGHADVLAIARQLEIAPIDVCNSLVVLLRQGLVTVHPPRAAAPAPQPHRPLAHPSHGGFFERLIAKTLTAEEPPPPPPADEPMPPSRYAYFPRRKDDPR